jgi:predicted nucleic acid-binding Zn ribbon protein
MTKRPHMSAPAPIQEILDKILKPADLRQLELQARLRQVWEASVSQEVRQYTQLVDFKSKTLYVGVAGHAWAQELHFLKPRILGAMQRELGAQVIKEITFRPLEEK